MNLNSVLRRNRFKNKAKVQKAPWQWPVFVTEWRKYARRAALTRRRATYALHLSKRMYIYVVIIFI